MRPGQIVVYLLGLCLLAGTGIGVWEALQGGGGGAAAAELRGVVGLLAAPPATGQGRAHARVSLVWTPETSQVKCYVGKVFTGIAGEGGETAAAKKLQEVAQVATQQKIAVNLVVDADPRVPYGHVLHVVNVVSITTGAAPTFALPAEAVIPPKPRNAPGPGLPVVANARTVNFETPPWLLSLDGASGAWSLGVHGRSLQPMQFDAIPAQLQQVRAQLKPGQGSAILISLPADSTWGVAQAAIQRLRAGGLTEGVFLCRLPAPAPARK